MRESAVTYRRSIGQLLAGIRGEVDGSAARLAEIAKRIEASEAAATELVARAQAEAVSQFAPLEKQTATLATAVEAERTRVTGVVTDLQDRFLEAQAARNKAVEDLIESAGKRFGQVEDELEARSSALADQLKSQALGVVAELERHEKDARATVSTTAAMGIAGGYGEYASEQKKAADFWRLAASAAVLAAVATVLILFHNFAELDLEHSLQRSLITVPIFAFAAYAAAQSSRHRENERFAKKTSLELAALEPYLALLKPEDRDKIKTDLAMRLFGQPLSPQGDDRIGAPQLWEELVKVLAKPK